MLCIPRLELGTSYASTTCCWSHTSTPGCTFMSSLASSASQAAITCFARLSFFFLRPPVGAGVGRSSIAVERFLLFCACRRVVLPAFVLGGELSLPGCTCCSSNSWGGSLKAADPPFSGAGESGLGLVRLGAGETGLGLGDLVGSIEGTAGAQIMLSPSTEGGGPATCRQGGQVIACLVCKQARSACPNLQTEGPRITVRTHLIGYCDNPDNSECTSTNSATWFCRLLWESALRLLVCTY